MIRPFRLLVTLTIGIGAMACGADAPTSTRTKTGGPDTPTARPTAVGLEILPDTSTMTLGSSLTLAAFVVMSDGSRLPSQAQWMSGNEQVASLNSTSGVVTAVGPGYTAILAQAGNLFAGGTIVVVPPPRVVPQSGALIVERFEAIEFQYASPSDQWFYAPQIRVRAAPGRKVTVLLLNLSIPGFGPAPPIACGGTIGESPRELNGEVYGDWTFAFDSPGKRATSAQASAVISFVDDAGTMSSVTVDGPIVSGGLPGSYSGGQNGGPCFHGYGGTG